MAVPVAWDPCPGTDGDNNADIAQLRREVWVRTGCAVPAEAALNLGKALMPAGPAEHVLRELAGRPAGEYVRQVVASMPLGQLAAVAGVEPRVPARPAAAVPDPDADAELAGLRQRRAGLERRVHECRERAAPTRAELADIERLRRAVVAFGDDTASFAAQRQQSAGRLENAEEAGRLLAGEVADVDGQIAGRQDVLAAEAWALQADADAAIPTGAEIAAWPKAARQPPQLDKRWANPVTGVALPGGVVALVLAMMLVTVWFPGPSSQGATVHPVHLCNHPGIGRAHKPYLTYGMTRIRANAWAGPSARRFCVTTNGYRTRVDTSAAAYAGNVVAYPDSETGPEYTWPDRLTGLPERVGELRLLTFHVGCSGRAPGGWMCDLDSWFWPRPGWRRHGTFELVVANRSSSGISPGGQLVWIHGVAYKFREWITSDRRTGLRWPLAVFRPVRQTRSAAVRVGRFTWWLRRHGLFPRAAGWYASSGYGPEIWSRGRGLVFWSRVTGLPPVVRKLP